MERTAMRLGYSDDGLVGNVAAPGDGRTPYLPLFRWDERRAKIISGWPVGTNAVPKSFCVGRLGRLAFELNPMSEIITFISSVGGSALLTAGLIFLARNLIAERLKNAIKHEYDEKLETHKAQLRREYDREIEQLKAQLQIAAAERSIRLSRVFDKTADTIATTYAKLLAFQKAVEVYTQMMPTDGAGKAQHMENIRSKSNDFSEYYLPRKIYLPKATAEKIRNFSNAIHNSLFDFSMAMTAINARIGPQHVEKRLEKFQEVQKEIPALLQLLEADFQTILGLEEQSPNMSTSQQSKTV
jgi:hypothetical protein